MWVDMTSFAELRRRVDRIDGLHKAAKAREGTVVAEMASVKEEIDLLTKGSAVLKHLLDIMVKDEIEKMASLVTYGIKTIFEGQNLSFLPVITKKADRMHVELKTVNDGVEGEFDSYGGSVAVIESFLLRVLCILKKKYARLLLLDETFRTVGAEYIANTSRLISELSKKLGMDVLLVTHQDGFRDNADHVYRVRRSDDFKRDGIIMEKIK